MVAKVGTVDSANLDPSGQEGKYTENGGGNRFDFVIHRPNVYVIPGDSIKVLVETPSGHSISKGIVIEINQKAI